MNHLFPPLMPKEAVEPPVLVIVAHPDDEVIGCGAMLAWHRHQGHAVTVIHVTDGGQGDPEGKFGDIRERRRQEGREALRRLGVEDVRSLGIADGTVPDNLDEVSARLRDLFGEIQPRAIYSFFFTEAHRDHRAVSRSVVEASDVLAADCRVLLFGVNQVVCGGSMFDVTELMAQKQHALAAFESQLYYNDFALKILHRDHAATVNVEDSAVQHAELFADLRPGELAQVCGDAEKLYRYLLRDAQP
ncbi:MAG: PIG-L family deacetylase [Planctomycetota bacterium]|nr:PIG-L family deacetylase [Planctomycetota bacterium]